ncbi:hypothetical protein E4U14_003449 [Claviceps sp. LM454 group G7]|nr:hypothetical protein E4U14_003449 [Claviceps sp. LM454 group G7]
MHYQRLRATVREDRAVLITLKRQKYAVESSLTGKTQPSFINLHGVTSFNRVWIHELIQKARDYVLAYISSTNSRVLDSALFDDPFMKYLLSTVYIEPHHVPNRLQSNDHEEILHFVARKGLVKLELGWIGPETGPCIIRSVDVAKPSHVPQGLFPFPG